MAGTLSSSSTPSPSDVRVLVEKALATTENRLAATPTERRGMLSAIRNQLLFMQDLLAADRRPTIAEKNSLNLGAIAVRELEDSDIVYCDDIVNAVWAFKLL